MLHAEDIVRVVDGDTFIASFFIFHNLKVVETIRVLGIDTPEMKGATKDAAIQSKNFTESWLKNDAPINITICKRDSFGRSLATVSKSGEDLADALANSGFGRRR